MYLATYIIIFEYMDKEFRHRYDELQNSIPAAGFEELKQISDSVKEERGLYSEITLGRILRMISKRLRELGSP